MEYESKQEVTQKMIRKIQDQEIKRQINKGSIFNGQWNQVVYSGVENEHVAQWFADRLKREAGQRHQDYKNFIEVKTEEINFKEALDSARQKKVNGLNNVIYDGFNSKK